MKIQKNIKLGRINFLINFLLIFFLFTLDTVSDEKDKITKRYTKIKILDKISSKNISLKLINGENFEYSDLLIKSIKCKHS